MGKRSTLAADVSAAFERACRERDLEVAEHLFQALEAMARRADDDRVMAQAFGVLLDVLPSDPNVGDLPGSRHDH